jgi:hypothetical protein
MPPRTRRTKEVVEEIEEVTPEHDGAHPLFPAQDSESEPPEIGWISLCRWNSQRGQLEYIPRKFSAEEIQDLSQIYELFGGGRYELVGRNRAGNRIVAKRAYTVAGEPRPLTQETPVLDTKPAFTPPPATPAAPGFNVSALLPILVPILLEYFKSSATERQAAAQQMQTVFMTMLQQQQSSSQAFITAMSNLHTTQATVGSGSRADFMAGIEFAENMLAGKMEEIQKTGVVDSGEIFKTIGQAFELLKVLPAGQASTVGAVAAAAQNAAGGPTA